MVKSDEIQKRIQAAFPDAQVVVEDTTGGGDHFQVRVASDAFRGRSRLEQHRLVYAALGSDVGVAIHALALKTEVLT